MPHRLLVKDHVDLDPRLQSVYLDNQGTQSYKNSQYYTTGTWLFNIKDDGKSSLLILVMTLETFGACTLLRVGLNERVKSQGSAPIQYHNRPPNSPCLFLLNPRKRFADL